MYCYALDRPGIIIIIIIISAHKSDLSYPWSQTQASLSIPSLHPKKKKKKEKERKKITDEKISPDLIGKVANSASWWSAEHGV